MIQRICPKCKGQMKNTTSPTHDGSASGSVPSSEPPFEQATPFDSSACQDIKAMKTYWLCPKCGYAEES